MGFPGWLGGARVDAVSVEAGGNMRPAVSVRVAVGARGADVVEVGEGLRTVVDSWTWLLSSLGSAALLVTYAVLMIVSMAGPVSSMRIIRVCGELGCNWPRGQLTWLACRLTHLTVGPNSSSADGSTMSVTHTLPAICGPLFVITKVYVRRWPLITGSGESLLVITKSAPPVGVGVGLWVIVGVAVAVAVCVFVGVEVGVSDGVGDGVIVGVHVEVLVDVGVRVLVGVRVKLGVAVAVGVGVRMLICPSILLGSHGWSSRR